MALTVTPDSGTQTIPEFTAISLTVACSDSGTPGDPVPITDPPTPPNPDMPGPAVVILSATCADSGITVSHTNTTFSVSGQFDEVFARTLNYLDINNLPATATKFKDIPQSFSTLVKYVAPSELSRSAIISVTFQNHSALSYVITVLNNWQSANAMLKETVPKGAF